MDLSLLLVTKYWGYGGKFFGEEVEEWKSPAVHFFTRDAVLVSVTGTDAGCVQFVVAVTSVCPLPLNFATNSCADFSSRIGETIPQRTSRLLE